MRSRADERRHRDLSKFLTSYPFSSKASHEGIPYGKTLGVEYTTNQTLHFDACATFKVVAPPLETEHHSEHEGWEFAFGATGVQEFRLRSSAFSPVRENVLLYNGREAHKEAYPSEQIATCQALVVFPHYIDTLLETEGINANEVVFDRVQIEGDRALLQLLKTVMEFREAPESSYVTVDAALTDLLIHVLTTYCHSHSKRLAYLSREARFPNTIAKLKRAISKNALNADLSLNDLSNEVGMSKFHLVHTFKKATGHSPLQYRNQIRLDTAKRLLTSTSSDIASIAERLGYHDISTFNKAFKKAAGMAPSTFRTSRLTKPQ